MKWLHKLLMIKQVIKVLVITDQESWLMRFPAVQEAEVVGVGAGRGLVVHKRYSDAKKAISPVTFACKDCTALPLIVWLDWPLLTEWLRQKDWGLHLQLEQIETKHTPPFDGPQHDRGDKRNFLLSQPSKLLLMPTFKTLARSKWVMYLQPIVGKRLHHILFLHVSLPTTIWLAHRPLTSMFGGLLTLRVFWLCGNEIQETSCHQRHSQTCWGFLWKKGPCLNHLCDRTTLSSNNSLK